MPQIIRPTIADGVQIRFRHIQRQSAFQTYRNRQKNQCDRLSDQNQPVSNIFNFLNQDVMNSVTDISTGKHSTTREKKTLYDDCQIHYSVCGQT